jgi:hypothetical protein
MALQFDESKLIKFPEEKYSTHLYICKINVGYNIAHLTYNYCFRTPIISFYTKKFIKNINITIGGADIASNYANFIYMCDGWFKMQFFLNDPVLPLNALSYMLVGFNVILDKNQTTFEWPDIYYMPVANEENVILSDDFELIVQNTDGLYNSIGFKHGLGGVVFSDSFRLYPYKRLIKYLNGDIELYKSSANSINADSMQITKKMCKEHINNLEK